ncbi:MULTISPECIES: hypothetical protein [Bacillus]|uniref:Uncharacterized protein n=1 Tax=Bacillus capparidis TaxID=1840411 RepID=A0ABS4D311_9BACI|nr:MULTISPECIES: hypothetical protein [Bacillus]MBP1083980.1 hypothetical protein [Bacillus capparidis]MED1096974.1 hypothetical protein [Bacillus capparidis]
MGEKKTEKEKLAENVKNDNHVDPIPDEEVKENMKDEKKKHKTKDRSITKRK